MPTLQVTPSQSFTQDFGEECGYTLDINAELGTKTVANLTYVITDRLGSDVTSTLGGGWTNTAGVIAFGVKGAVRGSFTLKFTVTCAEKIPDAVTPYEFFVTMRVRIS